MSSYLSSHPDEVNHDLSFTKSPKLAHIAYEVDSLGTLREFHRDLKRRRVKILYVLNFGWSIGMTFEDPEGNKVELFWSTGHKTPTRAPIDLERSDDEIAAILDAVLVG